MKVGFFVLWFGIAMAATSSLMVGHVITLPAPKAGDTLPSIVEENVQSAADHCEPALVLHVLYGDCPCSRGVLDQVLLRSPIDGIRERIVFVGKRDARQEVARSRGFEVEELSPAELDSRYGLQSAPLLVIVDHVGTILYSGGYAPKKQGPVVEDTRVIESVLNGESPASLPVYGCAVSRQLQSALDPLGLKYSNDSDNQ